MVVWPGLGGWNVLEGDEKGREGLGQLHSIACLAVHKRSALPLFVPAFLQFLDLFSSEYRHVLFFFFLVFFIFNVLKPFI